MFQLAFFDFVKEMYFNSTIIFTVYVLYSLEYNKTYTGFTSNLIERFRSHNELGKKGFTKRYRPWIVVWVESYESKKEAMTREKYLKSGIGRKFIREEIIPNYKH